jgi:methyl coenzyme M reductase beta subunit
MIAIAMRRQLEAVIFVIVLEAWWLFEMDDAMKKMRTRIP